MPKIGQTKPTVNVFFLAEQGYGGWLNYTSHLVKSLEAIGVRVLLFKVGNKTEAKTRNFHYGTEYRNLCEDDAIKQVKSYPTLISAMSKRKIPVGVKLLKAGAHITIHDPDELKFVDTREALEYSHRPIMIRDNKVIKGLGGYFIPHPYIPKFSKEERRATAHRTWAAVTISRIDFDKKFHMVLDANRLLRAADTGIEIKIFGFENRLYTRTKILPNYPEYKQSTSTYDREDLYAGANICHDSKFMVDMSMITNDGGGTQYTFLEAMDAGALPILNKEWTSVKGEMEDGINCFAVQDYKEIVGVIRSKVNPVHKERLHHGAEKILKAHMPKIVANMYMDEITK